RCLPGRDRAHSGRQSADSGRHREHWGEEGRDAWQALRRVQRPRSDCVGTVHGVAAPPVLCYHRIAGPPELGVTRIGRSVFARQMRALAEAGWRTLTLAEFAAAVRRTRHAPLPHAPTPSKVFLLTFDDGYASIADHAYPLLAELSFTATTFLITDHVGRTNTWDVRYTWRRLAHLDWPAIEAWRSTCGTWGGGRSACEGIAVVRWGYWLPILPIGAPLGPA